MSNRNYGAMQIEFFDDRTGKPCISIKNADLLYGSFRNFSGTNSRFGNDERYFNIGISSEYIPRFVDEGIAIHTWTPTNDDGTPQDFPAFVKVKINYKYSETPQIAIREGLDGKWIELPENGIDVLDKLDFDSVGLILRIAKGVTRSNQPYTSLYLKSGMFTKHVEALNAYEEDFYNTYNYNPNAISEEEMPFV